MHSGDGQRRAPSVAAPSPPDPHCRKTDEEGVPEPKEPNLDSGYAWVILLVMFLLNSTISGSSRVYGLVYAKQVAVGYYDREEASWPIATASAVENLAGILTPALATALTWRQIELLSTALFVAANLGAYFSSSLALDTLCLGLVQGLALSMSTVLSLAINNEYFESLRTTAYGISMSGSTFGVLYLAPIVGWLLGTYEDFRLVYLALAVVFSFNTLLVLFIKPRARVQAPAARADSSAARSHRSSVLSQHIERKISVASVSLECRSRRQSTWSQRRHATVSSPKHANCAPSFDGKRTASVNDNLVAAAAWSRKVSAGLSGAGAPPRKSVSVAGPMQQALAWERAHKFMASPTPAAIESRSRDAANDRDSGAKLEDGRPASGAETATTSDTPSEFSAANVLRLLRLPYLHCVWLMLGLYYLISRVFIIILVDFAVDHGLELDQSRQLLNFWSLGEIVGRIVLGSLIDLQWVSVKSCITLTCSALSAAILAMVLVESYYVYAACSALIAALVSLEYMLINVLMVEYVGKAQVTSCYSVAAFISSLVLFGRPTLIGLFRDKLGSYDGLLFLLAGATLAYALLFYLLEPLLVRFWPKCNKA